MGNENYKIKMFTGAIIMVVLQLFLAPVISINTVVPNFLLAFTISCIVARPDRSHILFSFVMGILFDIFTSGPVGAMSFVLVAVSFAVSLILRKIENVNFAISIITIILCIFCSELIYGAFQMALLVNSSFVEILSFRVLPCTLYDVILGVIIFPIVLRLLVPPITTNAYSDQVDNTR